MDENELPDVLFKAKRTNDVRQGKLWDLTMKSDILHAIIVDCEGNFYCVPAEGGLVKLKDPTLIGF